MRCNVCMNKKSVLYNIDPCIKNDLQLHIAYFSNSYWKLTCFLWLDFGVHGRYIFRYCCTCNFKWVSYKFKMSHLLNDCFNIMYDTQKYIVFIECNISFGICISELCHPLVGTSTRRDVFLKILQIRATYMWVWIILESQQGPVPPLWHWMISDHSWLWIGSQKLWWRCK